MTDDFEKRSMAYELSSYRQARELFEKFHARYGQDPKWQSHFQELREWLGTIEKYLGITPEQKANPAIIPYWYAPYRLMNTATKSRPFMQFLEKWLYGETSAQAHLNPSGLFSMGAFLISEFGPENERATVKVRNLERFTFPAF